MKAFILAAGRGTRLGDLSKVRPKCLNDIGGITMLGYILEQIKNLGIKEVIINVYHLGDQIIDYVEKYNSELDIKISNEPELLGIIGGLKYASHLVQDDFILINSDIYTDFDLKDLIEANQNSKSLITLLANNDLKSPILIDGNILVGIESKTGLNIIPDQFSDKKGFAGIQVIKKEFLELLEQYPSESFLFTVYFDLISKGHFINVLELENSQWIDMGTPEELEKLRNLKTAIK